MKYWQYFFVGSIVKISTAQTRYMYHICSRLCPQYLFYIYHYESSFLSILIFTIIHTKFKFKRRQICDVYSEYKILWSFSIVMFISVITNITNLYYKCVATLKLFYVFVTMLIVYNNHITFYIKNYISVARSITKFHKEIEASKWNNRWRIRLLICIHKYIHVYCIYIILSYYIYIMYTVNILVILYVKTIQF